MTSEVTELTPAAPELGTDISQRIARLLQLRQEQLPRIHGEIARWRGVDEELGNLSLALEALRRHPTVSQDDAAGLTIPHLQEIRTDIAEVIELYRGVEGRFSRETVNIGVSGSARVGKSTLLQSISGLTDEQIPTGRDLPVTAVRSRIYHSPRTRSATVRLHSAETFLTEVIRPYHQALNLNGTPSSLEEFRNWIYPDESQSSDVRPGDLALLVRLREMQQSLPTYQEDLRGGEMSVRLEDLRPYVAYPTSQDRSSGGRLEHRYLAVRDVRIDCTFPKTDVGQLGIIDLPGLGEVAAEAERQHVAGLRQDVDVVLLVKRAAESMAFWGASDAAAINLLDEARGFIRNRGDFVSIVINARPEDTDLADTLRADILRQVNDGQSGRYFATMNADVAEPESVRQNVLLPLLATLAERLPVMDEEYLAGARESASDITSGIHLALREVSGTLSGLRAPAGPIEDLEDSAKELREDLAEELGALVEKLKAQATAEEDDPGYVDAIDAAYGDVRIWIDGGFGLGENEWCRRALRSFRVHRNIALFGGDELNRIRVEISTKFAKLDDFFSARVEAARGQVGAILQENLGNLLTGTADGSAADGTRLLEQTAVLLADASEPCQKMEEAVLLLLGLRLEYRAQLHPRVRSQLDVLNIQLEDPRTHEQVVKAMDPSPEGAVDLFTWVTQQAKIAAAETMKALLAEKATPLMVIYAAVEQFEDALIRSGDAEREFRRFSRSYRDELWPGKYAGLTEEHARYASVARLIKSVDERLS